MFFKYPVRGLKPLQKEFVEKFNREIEAGLWRLEEIFCPVCNSAGKRVLFANDRYGIRQKTVLCRDCGMVYASPRFTPEENERFYTSETYRNIYNQGEYIQRVCKKYEIADAYRHAPANPKEYRPFSFLDFLIDSGIEYQSVFEIGAGGGVNLLPLLNMAKCVAGCEYSAQAAALANSRGIGLVQGGATKLSEGYDLVILKHVLEHFLDPVEQLLQIKKNTKFLLVEIPGFETRVPSLQNAHTLYFSLNTLQMCLLRAGFAMVRWMIFPKNSYIIALFESNDGNLHFQYDGVAEVKRAMRAVNRFKFARYLDRMKRFLKKWGSQR